MLQRHPLVVEVVTKPVLSNVLKP